MWKRIEVTEWKKEGRQHNKKNFCLQNLSFKVNQEMFNSPSLNNNKSWFDSLGGWPGVFENLIQFDIPSVWIFH